MIAPSEADRVLQKQLSADSIESGSSQKKLPPKQLSLKTLGKASISRDSTSQSRLSPLREKQLVSALVELKVNDAKIGPLLSKKNSFERCE